MQQIKIKALSVNRAFMGRRFKTQMYKSYETELYYLLPKIEVPKKDIRLDVEFGIPTSMDIDSGLKQFIDVCQKKYDFNDRYIMELHVKKVVVKKGSEYIKFKFSKLST